MDEPKTLDTVYKCVQALADPNRYGQTTYWLQRADGFAGELVISGSAVHHNAFVEGKTYKVKIEEV